jgi:hypothetical protein
MLIYFKVFMEWIEIGTCWNLKNCGFSICIGSTTSWTDSNDFTITTVGSVMEITGLVNTTCSTWMLITWSKLGSSSSSMLPCVVFASSSSPLLPPISSE